MDTEIHNRIEDRIDNCKVQFPYLEHMTDLVVVDNLDPSIDLEVDNLEVNTDTGVDLDLEVNTLEVDTLGVDTLEVNIDTEVDPGVHIEAGVDLEACIAP